MKPNTGDTNIQYARHTDADAGKSEDDDDTNPQFAYTETTIRHAFIRKVYCILLCQVIMTTGFVVLMRFEPNTNHLLQDWDIVKWVLVGCIAVIIPTLLMLTCSRTLARKTPANLIILFIFTVAESVLVGAGTSVCDKIVVLQALGLTAVICFGLTVFAFQTRRDFTSCGGILFLFLLVLIITGVAAIIYPSYAVKMFITSAGIFLFSIYLIYDTQLMMGSRKYEISPEDYVYASLRLYLDVINIFVRILRLLR